MSKRANLRVCASCEWIFTRSAAHPDGGCPKCLFVHYGARYVYGKRAYIYATTQKPWFDKRMAAYAAQLEREIRDSHK